MIEVAHLCLFGEHLEVRKTEYRIQTNFLWPEPFENVTSFCRLCDVCQKTVPKRSVPRNPLGNMLFIDQLFERVAIDLVGPIAPAVNKEHKSIGCFIFLSVLKLKKLGSAYDGILNTDFKSVIFIAL